MVKPKPSVLKVACFLLGIGSDTNDANTIVCSCLCSFQDKDHINGAEMFILPRRMANDAANALAANTPPHEDVCYLIDSFKSVPTA